jgi:hypothetical protein
MVHSELECYIPYTGRYSGSSVLCCQLTGQIQICRALRNTHQLPYWHVDNKMHTYEHYNLGFVWAAVLLGDGSHPLICEGFC